MDEKQNIHCYCYNVPYEKLISIIKENDCKNHKDVQKYCNAGRACGMCIPYIDTYCNSKK
jgi:NAD(P)H-nitrite reductase large subunit